MFEIYSNVVLVRALLKLLLNAGTSGVVVHIYSDGLAYEVEFFDEFGKSLGVETISSENLSHDQSVKVIPSD